MPNQRPDGSWKEPRELQRMRKTFTEEKAHAKFQELRGRPPHSNEELEIWTEHYTLELYNSGHDVA